MEIRVERRQEMPCYLRLLRLSVALNLTVPSMVLAQPSALGTFTTFNFPGAGYTQARYLDSSGEVVGFYFEGPAFASPAHGFLRSKDGELSPIDSPGTNGTKLATGINSAGDIVGYYGAGGTTPHGFMRAKDGEFTSLDYPGATSTQAWGINSRGDIVGVYGAGGTTHGFVLNKDGGFSSFDVPGPINAGAGTQTRGISDRGDIVGWFVTSSGTRRGYLLRQDQFTFIDCPSSFSTSTDWGGINSKGDIVGGCVDTQGHHA
jgi:hypothetical protein